MINPETRPPHAPPGLFHPFGLVILLGVTLVAARLGSPWVALLAGCLLLVGLAARLWARYALAGLTYTRQGIALGTWAASSTPAVGDARAQGPDGGTGQIAAHPLAPGDTRPVRAFCGDTLRLETRLGNRKLLPLPWVEVWERLPLALSP